MEWMSVVRHGNDRDSQGVLATVREQQDSGMRALRLVMGLALALVLAGCGGAGEGTATKPVMPEVKGDRLDVALDNITRAGIDAEVKILGGGTFGVVKKSNWTVCDQLPAAGRVVDGAPRLTVERSCGSETHAPGTSTSAEPPSADASDRYMYRETAKTTARSSRGPDVPLAISVAAPVAFTPSDPADARQGASVYFTVTITNLSKTDSFTADVVVREAICGLGRDPSLDNMSGKGTKGDWIFDSDAGITGLDGSPKIEPERSITFKDGYSVSCGDDVTYKIQPAGLAADTLYFQK